MGRYSYSQPSEDETLFGNNDDSDYSDTEDLIRRDQAELSLERCSPVHYPPQPEVEFGFPQVCYCGAQPVLATSNTRNDQADYDTEEKLRKLEKIVGDMAKEKSCMIKGFEWFVIGIVVLVVVICMVVMLV
ncbi:hypothetical protein IGI04_021884 [Brassica rapa subsp. trilocularis]|uniref:Transmembrane protein n=1 Tax=Brassica rapa subsp. trilocularis TaxID=1813537 RepID=A0ABQ7LZC9_BRACM|nr:hypothetical protein IGI04_021884 [Brassica rapa subsp. trilocularis]